jgi:hypothetical protein
MEAMRRGGLDTPPMGGGGGVVEVDETYFGNVPEEHSAACRRSVVAVRTPSAGPTAPVTSAPLSRC